MEERLRSAVVQAAQAAGEYLHRDPRKGANEVEKKCKDLMLRTLRSAEPSVSLWNESPNRNPERAFSVYALDSCVNFSRGIGPYGSMASYIEEGVPIFGALYLPESEQMFVAERGKGARQNGRRIGVNERGSLSKSVVCCECSSFDEELRPMSLGVIQRLAKHAMLWRNLGSPAAEYAFLSSGRIDGLVASLHESGHAAGVLLMQEAGAVVTDGEGNPFSMHSANIVAASPSVHAELLALVGRAL